MKEVFFYEYFLEKIQRPQTHSLEIQFQSRSIFTSDKPKKSLDNNPPLPPSFPTPAYLPLSLSTLLQHARGERGHR